MTSRIEVYPLRSGTAIIASPPICCPRCNHPSYWFWNTWGQTYCSQCEPPEKEEAR